MLISSEKLIGLKVETESGQYVGRVQSFDIDIESHTIRNYHIKPKFLEGGSFYEEIMVHHLQVVSISEEKMVVVDNIVKYKEEIKEGVFIGTQAQA
jgi:sporulation protein YlmC with PRC-barrel domain